MYFGYFAIGWCFHDVWYMVKDDIIAWIYRKRKN